MAKQQKYKTITGLWFNAGLYRFRSESQHSESELHVTNVTSSGLRLRWSAADPKVVAYFEVAVTRLRDHALVLRTNVTATQLALDNLESGQTYHAVVTAHTLRGHPVSTHKGVVTTSK